MKLALIVKWEGTPLTQTSRYNEKGGTTKEGKTLMREAGDTEAQANTELTQISGTIPATRGQNLISEWMILKITLLR